MHAFLDSDKIRVLKGNRLCEAEVVDGKIVGMTVECPQKNFKRRFFEAVDAYPKVVCADAVRWSCYDDGTVMLLNTEDVICQEAVVYHDSASFRRVKLAPGELKILDGNVCIKRNRLRERLRKNIAQNSLHEEDGCCNLVNSNTETIN